MKQVLTILTTFGAMILISASASASSPTNVAELELATRPTTTVLNASDALGIVAQCSGGGYGNYYGGGYDRGYVPVRRSYYRGGGGGGLNISVGGRGGGFGGVPYGYGRGYSRGPSFGRGYNRGFGGGSGFGLFLNL